MPARDERCRLAENVVIAMRTAAMNEMLLNTEAEMPTFQQILPRMSPSVESTPHANTQIYGSSSADAQIHGC